MIKNFWLDKKSIKFVNQSLKGECTSGLSEKIILNSNR